jgi:hypothetical protein
MKKITYNQLVAKNGPLKIGNGHLTKSISLKSGGKSFQKAQGAIEVTKAQIAEQDNEHSYPGPGASKEKTINAIDNKPLPNTIEQKIITKKKKLE